MLAEHGATLEQYGFPEPEHFSTELEEEKARYTSVEEAAKLEDLHMKTPNNVCQEAAFTRITQDICRQAEGCTVTAKYFIEGQGGCGKTTLAKKLLAFVRSKGLIALGCASTGLAATNYDNFFTAHALFCFPVVDEDDKDESDPAECELLQHPERLELLQNASVIIWDEMICNHKELYEAAYRATQGFYGKPHKSYSYLLMNAGKIIIAMGDWRQIMPIVKRGVKQEVLDACIKSSFLWQEFTVLRLDINMRLAAINQQLQEYLSTGGSCCSEYFTKLMHEVEMQSAYAGMITCIGEGRSDHSDIDLLNENEELATQIYRIHTIPYFTHDMHQSALKWLYPNGFCAASMHNTSILVATNTQGDHWNSLVQQTNPNPPIALYSTDKLCEVDDPHKHLQNMLTSDVMNGFTSNGVPHHELVLKVDDICIVLRNLSKRYGLATNTRVRILHITESCIRVQTINDHPKTAYIPRIRFKFRLPFAESFDIMRTQFPLRLAYSMTFNKSQGQTIERVLVDTTVPPFSHGHTYVALSRVTRYDSIRIFCQEQDIHDEHAAVQNTAYTELLD